MNDGSRQVSTCLLLVSLAADLDVIKFTLRHINVDVTRHRDSRHETVLHKACKSHVQADLKTKFLVSNYPELRTVTTPCGTLPLHIAAKHNKPECLGILLKDNPNDVNTKTSRGMTPLHIAASVRSSEAAEFLMNCDFIYVNAQDVNGDTPAHNAAYHILCDVNTQAVHGNRPAHCASTGDYLKLLS